MQLLIDVNNKLSQPVNCQLFCVLITNLVDKRWPLADFFFPASQYGLGYPSPVISMSISLGNENAPY